VAAAEKEAGLLREKNLQLERAAEYHRQQACAVDGVPWAGCNMLGP
jgi:hypothetical protein